ncbi:minor tail protein [Gordonia phage Ghobes]|uniref:Minor tail protein n=1 Tax=Gordonia phage Ghobes TaxID=1887647 RepID=A0A1B3B063_9CAUD|nr:minor tail protein [Gordonia phage Ghobes]AOE44368.1 minor tail protein [Gordonia phage Ghobes]
MSYPLTTHTVVRYVSPDGEVLPLSGGPDAGKYQVWLGHDPVGLGHVETKALFDAAARQWGEEYVGETVDHQELELPLFVLTDHTGVDGLRRRREWLKKLFPRDRVGWLCVYTNVTGWRWLATRRGSLKPVLGADPNARGGLELELVLLVENPLARVADSNDSWRNTELTGKGSLLLYPGPEYHGWPQFTVRGPGRFRFKYLDNDVLFDFNVLATETLLVNTDEARPTVRGRTDAGVQRNLLPLVRGTKFRTPLPKDTPTRVDVTVTNGNANSAVYGVCAQQLEGLL